MAAFQSDAGRPPPPEAGDGGSGNPPDKKEKKKPPLCKQMSTKISTASSKLTELMAWKTKCNDCSTLYLNTVLEIKLI